MNKTGLHVAIASTYRKMNYGTVLQAYATQEALRELGCPNAKTVETSGLGRALALGRRSYYMEHVFDSQLYRAKLGFVGHRLRQKVDKGFGERIGRRRRVYERFVDENFDLTPEKTSFEDLAEMVKGFDVVVVGSDQQWLPVNIAGDYYTLSWVPDGVRKVSYATSFGVSELPPKYLTRASKFLADFDAISVREDSGASIVERATGKRCKVVCDPTMLVRPERWREIAESGAELVPDRPYVLCYFLGKNIWNRACALELAKRAGCKVVAIAHPDEYVKFDDTYADIYPWDAGPAEWLALVANASYVCTDSFHGTVFANLFEIPFFSFRRHENMGAQSTNSRLDTLLGVLGSSDRICHDREAFEAAMACDVDFAAVITAVDAYRARSESWLRQALLVDGDAE